MPDPIVPWPMSFEHKDSQRTELLQRLRTLACKWRQLCHGCYLRALAIKKQDLGYDVLFKPGEELVLRSMEGHGSVDYNDVRLAQALFPRKKTLKAMKNLTEGVEK